MNYVLKPRNKRSKITAFDQLKLLEKLNET